MRYHAYALKRPRQASRPYVVDLQNNLLDRLRSRLVAPLQRKDSVDPKEIIDGLMPVFSIAGVDFVLYVQEAAAYPVAGLGDVVGDFSADGARILNALDRLLG